MYLKKFLANKTIAVVGGALPTNMGKEIDSHDLVLRVSTGITKGFEKHVGTKTDIYVVGGFGIFDHYKLKPEFNCWQISFNPKEKNYPYMRKGLKLMDSCYFYIAKDVLGVRKPTCGFNILFYLYLNNIKADVYGFDFYKTQNYNTPILEKILIGLRGKDIKIGRHDIVHEPKKEEKYWSEHKFHNFRMPND